jgi:hypothetical protein
MAITTIPPTFYQVAFNADPNQAVIPPYWTDQSWRVQFPWSSARGRQYELDAVETGEWRPTLANPDGALDPSNTTSPYAPNVLPFRQARIQCKPGPNQLTPDQATAGEATGYPAGITAPAQMAVSNDFGYTVTLAASGTAYQGNQVYQVTVPGGATQFTTILLIKPVPVTPLVTYSFSAQVRINSGTSAPTNATILWYDTTGANISSIGGAAVTPTSGSSTWNQISVSGAAPSAAYSAVLKIEIASGGSTSASTVWQADGLQLEQNPFATPFQIPNILSANLFPGNLATGGYDTQGAAGWWYPTVGAVSYVTGLTAAPTGHTNAFAWTSPASTTSASPMLTGPAASGPVADIVQVAGSTAYSASFYALRAASADATLAVTATITWYGAAATSLGTSVGSPLTLATGTWGRLTVSGTSPAGALWGRVSLAVTTPASTTASNTVYLTAGQFEAAASPSSWRDTGPTYSIITPFVERWPQTWSEQDGTYGTSSVIGDDALVALSQYTLTAPFIEEVNALNPNFFYPLSDPQGSTSCADASGRRVAAPVENSPFGAGSLVFGGSITSVTAGSAFIGSSGPVATFANDATQNPPTQVQRAETFVSIHKTTSSPGLPNTGAWTRIIAFRAAAAPGTNKGYTLWDAEPASWTTNASLASFAINSLGQANIQWSNTLGNSAWDYTGTTNLCDGNWHLLAMGNDPAATGTVIWVDGAVVSTSPGSTGLPSGFVTDALGCSISAGRQYYDAGHIGDLAFAAEFPALLTSAQMSNLYNSWRTASQGESTGARIQRILTSWIGWTGATALDAGQTTSMGPATDLTGATALDACNNVTLTESGNFYAAANGTLTFKSRTARYGQLVPAYIFGEKTAVGEWPFENPFQFDDDSSHIANNVQVTQYGGSVYTALGATSSGRYFPRVYQRTINTTSAAECQDAAAYLLSQYKDAHMRVSALRLHPSAVPGLFQVCLALELGTRIRVNRRPNGAPQITWDGFVEKIEWEWDPDQGGEVFVNLQCSPADRASYWVLGALHTTLNAQAASGQNQATIRALPDSAVNALASSLPQGYQLTFDPGLPTQETMTLAATGIPATNPGYSTATLTFTSNFAFTHAANAVVCEPLPTGYTDPTTWDAASVIGAAYATTPGQVSGTTLLPVGTFGDAKTNALASDLATGDVIWIGPGTANFEGYNLLHPSVSTAGEGAIPLATGTSGAGLGLASDLGTPTVTASGTAFQGANVWQVSVAGGATTPKGLLYVNKVGAAPLLAFTVSAYTRSATTGANPVCDIYVKFLDANGATLTQTTSGTSTLTGSPTAAWTRLTATATAPAGTVWVQLGILLTGTAPAGAWSFQTDGLQVEQNGSASAYQTAPQVKSVTAGAPGYSSAQIVLAQNLINNHGAGEWVCDPLPPGTTNPTAVTATAKLAY